MCPLMLGLLAVAEPFVRIVLTDKWLPCVPLLQMFCIVFLFQPIHTANMQAIKAVGRSDIYLKLEIIKKTIELIVLIAVMWISVDAIVASMAILTTLFTFINAFPNKKLINYTFKEQMADILPSIMKASVMALCVYLIGFLPISMLPLMCIQVVSGGVIYIVLSVTTRCKEFNYIVNLVKSKLPIGGRA